MAEKDERGRKKTNQKPQLSFRFLLFLAANPSLISVSSVSLW
jgi:hypothetical protein